MKYFSGFGLILAFVYILVFLIIGWHTRQKHDEEYYQFYMKGLFAKLFGGLFFGLVYTLYYDGGDTTSYFRGAEVLYRMMFKNFRVFWIMISGKMSPEIYSYFDSYTGWPPFTHDLSTFSVCRFIFPIYIFGGHEFLSTTVLCSYCSYLAIWKFYEFLVNELKMNARYTAWALLYVPSSLIWCSGLMKDTVCYASLLMCFVLFNRIVFHRERIVYNFLILLIWIYIMISVRSFLFYVTIVCCMLWFVLGYIRKFDNIIFRIVLFPILIAISVGIGYFSIEKASSQFGGKYTVDNLMQQAWVIQDDLKRDYYGENSFDIGAFDPTIQGVLSKMPIAVFSGLFRPFIWESRSALMLFSAVENLFYFAFTIFILFKIGFFKIVKIIFSEPFLFATITFTLAFGFMVGLTTANFGALVRYAVPAKSFMIISLLILFDYYQKSIKE